MSAETPQSYAESGSWEPVQCDPWGEIAPQPTKAVLWVFGKGSVMAVSRPIPLPMAMSLGVTLAKSGIPAEVRVHG